MKVFADRDLAQRLERAEACGSSDFVDARTSLFPAVGACWTRIEGAYVMFDGIDSPITQTFGLGMFEEPTEGGLDEIERFYRERDAGVFHEVSPLAGIALARQLAGRGYQPDEFTSVMFRSLSDPLHVAPNETVVVRLAGPADMEAYADTVAKGWSEFTEYVHLMRDLARVSAARAAGLSFMAEIGDTPIATGSMSIHDGVALLAGTSTVPEFRNRGAQLALLEARLRYAADQGCDLAMMCAAPGSASQRNAERHGFRIAYTRTKWKL